MRASSRPRIDPSSDARAGAEARRCSSDQAPCRTPASIVPASERPPPTGRSALDTSASIPENHAGPDVPASRRSAVPDPRDPSRAGSA